MSDPVERRIVPSWRAPRSAAVRERRVLHRSAAAYQVRRPRVLDPAKVGPYPPKLKFDERIDPPITYVKPIRIGEDK